MSKYIDAELIEPFLKREEWDTPDERWRPESEFGRYIDAIPTADVSEVRHGRWIKREYCSNYSGYDYGMKCSVCGKPLYRQLSEKMPNYCPNCGAKMDEVGNELV